MNKISSRDAASLLKQAGAAIRHVSKERDEALAKVAAYERDARVVKIAHEMEEKGLSSDLNFEQKVAAIKTSPSLDVTQEAIKLAAPQSRIFGQPAEDQPSSGTGSSQSALEHYVMTGEDPSVE
jgi:hypothetical protein